MAYGYQELCLHLMEQLLKHKVMFNAIFQVCFLEIPYCTTGCRNCFHSSKSYISFYISFSHRIPLEILLFVWWKDTIVQCFWRLLPLILYCRLQCFSDVFWILSLFARSSASTSLNCHCNILFIYFNS